MVQFKSDPLFWWKRQADTYLSRYYNKPEEIYEGWRTWEFEEYLKKRPLKEEDVKYFLENRVTLSKEDMRSKGLMYPESSTPLRFKIKIKLDSPIDEQCLTLIHEVIHGFYRFRGSFGNNTIEEELVENEAIKFCQQHPQFVRGYLAENILLNAKPEQYCT